MPEFETSDGVRLWYDVRGSGPPVLICHGGPASVSDALANTLTPLEDSHSLVYHDYRGSGRSGNAASDTYTFERIADDLNELRAQLSYPQVSVLAHSMGGFIALNFALRHSSHCLATVLVGTTPTGKPAKIALPALRALGPTRTAKAVVLATWYAAAWSWRHESTDKQSARYAPMATMQEGDHSVRTKVRALRGDLVANDNVPYVEKLFTRTDLTGRLPEIRCPTLVLYGQRDAVMVGGGRMLAEGLCNAKSVCLPGIGHEPFIEDPKSSFSLVAEFLATAELGPEST